MIPIPTGRRYTSTIRGWVWRPVRCEFCGCEYAYRMPIVARGQGHSPMYLNNEGAKRSAQQRAQADFERKAQKQIAAVNCPICNLLQKNMANMLKTKRFQLLIGSLVVLGVSAFFAFWPNPYFDIVILYIAGAILLIDAIYLYGNRGYGQALYAIGQLVVLALWGFRVIDLMFYTVPIGVVIVLIDAVLALNYNPLKNAWQPGPKQREKMLVAQRAELEAAAAKLQAEKGQTIPMPKWT